MTMREICLVRLDKVRPAVILTREIARASMRNVTIAPITSTVKHLSSEVPVDQRNGLHQASVVSIDNITTVPASLVGDTIGYLLHDQERQLVNAMIAAFDLEAPLHA